MLLFGVNGPQGIGYPQLRGLGDFCTDDCTSMYGPSGDSPDSDQYQSCVNDCISAGGSLTPSTSASSPSSSKSSSGGGGGGGGGGGLVSFLTAGAQTATAAIQAGQPKPKATAPTAWYASPLGIAAIVVGVLGIAYMLKR